MSRETLHYQIKAVSNAFFSAVNSEMLNDFMRKFMGFIFINSSADAGERAAVLVCILMEMTRPAAVLYLL